MPRAIGGLWDVVDKAGRVHYRAVTEQTAAYITRNFNSGGYAHHWRGGELRAVPHVPDRPLPRE